MNQYGLVCLLLGAMTGSQAAETKPSPAAQQPTAPSQTSPATASGAMNPGESQGPASNVPPDAPVITISGLCGSSPADKTAATNCKTVITRAEFEKTLEAVQPTMSASARRQFAERYANALVMAQKAHERSLDQGPNFEEHIRLARIQVLSEELSEALQEKASHISDADIEEYYHKNLASFQEVQLKRIFIPHIQQLPTPREKLSDAEEQRRTQESENTMRAEADKLHARAAAGENFDKLQDEVFQLAGIKSRSPNTDLGKVRRVSLPPNQLSVMDMKPGETSPVFSDQSGYFIYKAGEKETTPLDKVREEIREAVHIQRMQDEMHAIQQSAAPTFDDSYFGPASGR